jgi:hypothetical protein
MTPMPLPAPRLLYRTPLPGEELALDAPITLTFDQPMDQASVEAAWTISPTVQGSFDWVDDRSLSFLPSQEAGAGLERGQRYQVTVAETAKNNEGLTLEEPAVLYFSTVGYLVVSLVMPLPDSDELNPDTTVTVVFNRPVVPLTALSSQGELPMPLTFMPPVRGKGEWLNTSIYLFRPDEGFLPATHYKARVASGLMDTTGAVLAEDYEWEFTTIQPAILEVRPPSGFKYVGPTDVISVTFNQPMDHASVQTRFSLEVNDEPVAGTFRWEGGEKPTSPETMIFVPDDPLPRDAEGSVKVEADVRARQGAMGTTSAKTWRFSTVKNPGIVSTSPRNGQTGVEVGSGYRIVFASPMETKGFMDHLTISPQVTNVYTYWSEYDTDLRIQFDQDPATTYNITIDPEAVDKYGGKLGEAERVRFTTGDLAPYAALNTDGRLGTFSTYTDTVLYATHRNISQLDVSLYQLSLDNFARMNSDWMLWEKFTPAQETLIRQWTQKVQGQKNKASLARLELVDERGNALPPGLYYVELNAPEVKGLSGERPFRYMFVKSGLNLTLKQTRTEALIWATDLSSGQPVPKLPISLYIDQNAAIGKGITDADGLFFADSLAVKDLWRPFFAITGEPGSQDFGIAYNGWDQGIGPWDFEISSEFWGSNYQGYLYTDRPIYRPGQTVYFKGIVRADDDARYSLPEKMKSVDVRVGDPQGNELYKETLPLSNMGTLFDELVLSKEAPLGIYFLEIQYPEEDLYVSTSFQVAEYRKPEFQISVSTDRPAYRNGDTIKVTAEAIYYFGGAVADAAVHWSVLSSDYWMQYECPRDQTCPNYSWTDYEWGSYADEQMYGSYGRLIAQGDAETDGQGRVAFKVPADIAQEIRSKRFTIEVTVTDINNQSASSRTEAVVHKGEFYVGIAPRGYLTEVGEEKQVDILTVDWDGYPMAAGELSVIFMEHEWYSARRQAEDGQFYWDWVSRDTPVYTTAVTTGADGRATAAFTPPKAGSYRVRAIGRDQYENEIRASAYFWVWGGSDYVTWRRESNNRIELIADKDEYQVGDIAEILVPSPYTGTVQALVTVERGHIIEMEVHEFDSNSEVLRVPITEEHVPNAFVSVIIVQGAEQAPDGLATFKMGVAKLPVSVESKELEITLTPDKPTDSGNHYSPRQTATYDVLVTDRKGRPVEAELSLRLADLAVLALADEVGPSLVEQFWRERGLGVKTSSSLVVAMEAFNRELAPGAKGGGGAEGADGLVRSQFADTAFWDPVVHTDKDGKAKVEVQLPDNLTTWRMQARGITADTRVGRTDVDVISALDLMVRPLLPRFFVVGDQAEIATIVHNNTADALAVQVNISAQGLTLQGQASQTVQVAAHDTAKVTWPVEALSGEETKIRMWASAGDLYDGREDTLPVYRYSTPEVVATAGQIPEPGVRQEIVQLPSVYDPTQGELTVKVDGSLTAATQDALSYLEHYPYECVEQTVSRFLPNVLTWQALDEMGVERPELRQKLAQMVGVALQKIYNQQHYDGGWGWWVGDKSDTYLSAYVLQGMVQAHRAGFVVDERVMARAYEYLQNETPSVARVNSHWEANRLAYQLYVLAEYAQAFDQEGSGQLGIAVRLFDKRHLLSQYGRATLAVALSLLEPDEPDRVQTLLSDLVSSAILSATGAHWEEGQPDYRNMNTDIRTTAIVLWALARLEPDNDLLPNTVRWLMAMRKQDFWESTQTTAWSLMGLVEYIRASGELKGDFSYALYLNGQELASGDVTQETIDESYQLQVEIARLLADQANRLVIERLSPQGEQTGEGQLYYSAHLRYFLPADHVQALNRGIIVARQYSSVDEPNRYVNAAQVGDVIKVKLTIVAPTDLHYVVVEDPLPAGFEGVDLSLKTTSVVGEQPELRNVTAEEQDSWVRWYGWGWWWFSHSEMRDEKVSLFAQYLPRGTYEYTYLIRASVPGEFLVMPGTASQMYFPEVFGRSDGAKFTVRAGD